MKNMTIKINMENAAFGRYPEGEVRRILRELVIGRYGLCNKTLYDINGNEVGEIKFT